MNCQQVIPRITKFAAINVDHLLSDFDMRSGSVGRSIFPPQVPITMIAPTFKDAETVVIGYRIAADREDLPEIGMKLAGLALERNVEVVVLSHLDYSGLERFGFRTERICGETDEAREACERQVMDFWNIQVVIG